MQNKSESHELELALARLAERQHGTVSHQQLLALGFSRTAINHRERTGRLHRIHQGVYAVGHRVLSNRGRWMAAVLAGGEGAVLSHWSAAALWGVLSPRGGAATVTVPGNRRTRGAIRFHRSSLPPDEVTVKDGIPVTTVPRTLFDLAAVAERTSVERAIREADYLRLWDRLSLPDLLARYNGRRGAGAVRQIVAGWDADSGKTRTGFEALFLAFLDEYGLPRPRVNHRISAGGRSFEADFAWPEQRLIVETDGRAAHGTRHAFESDRERDRILAVAGWLVIRVTWRQLERERAALAADLSRLLVARSR